MEISSSKWIPEMGMDYSSSFHQNQMSPLDCYLDILDFQSFSSESCYEISHKRSGSYTERPTKELKTNSWNSCTTELSTPKRTSPSSPSQIISFEKTTSSSAITKPVYGQDYAAIPKMEAASPANINFPSLISHGSYQQGTQLRAASTTRNALQAQDHVIAERKRREKLSERFIALSSLLPGLKKTDKASVLGDAIKYLQQLQERVKTLEEQSAKKTMESMIIVKKSHISSDDESSSSDDNFDSQSSQLYLPHIEARVSDRDVLIRIHCQNSKGCIVNVLNEIEKLPLTVVNSNVVPFGNSTLDITVVAQMEVGLAITVKDLVKNLRQALLKFI